MEKYKVTMTMEQTFADEERDCVQTETIAKLAFESDKLHIIYTHGEMIFEVGKTHPYPCLVDGYEFLLYITTDKLLRDGNRIHVEYKVAADLDNEIVSKNILKLELTEQ